MSTIFRVVAITSYIEVILSSSIQITAKVDLNEKNEPDLSTMFEF